MEEKNGVQVINRGPHSAVIEIGCIPVLPMPKGAEEAYLKDARRIIDKESAHLNAIGIGGLIGAMIYVYLVEEYTGKDN